MNSAVKHIGARLTHEWALHVFGTFVAALLIAIVVAQVAKRHDSTPIWLLWRRTAVVTAIATGAFFFVTQLHLFCDVIVADSHQCLSQVKDLAMAQEVYSEDNNDRFLSDPDWMERLSPRKPRCPDADGPVSYAVNKALQSRPTTEVNQPDKVPLVFDSLRGPLAGSECLAVKRHEGAPIVSYVDGHVFRANPYVQKQLVWNP
ncbi:MAG: hypothetical protein JSS66_16005 [Armatimonadetes bacterium]|nr:hypothetical protein [Armatimonadota bacterium]